MFGFNVKCYKRKEAVLLSWGAEGKAVLSPHYLFFYSHSAPCVSWALFLLFAKLIRCRQSQVELPGETYVFHWSLGTTGVEGGLCLPCLIRELLGLFVPLCSAHVCTQREWRLSEPAASRRHRGTPMWVLNAVYWRGWLCSLLSHF